ncbi:hypothetical protein NQ317_008184, partial [Molorchus minor]
PDIIARHGYPSESHTVITEDGYLLNIHRIPGTKSGQRGGQPVFLQHGLLGSSADWIINGNNFARYVYRLLQILSFLLADKGYDVWLGNARGNTYSKAHISIPVESAKYWNFSWHEMGTRDLPAELYYISNITGKPAPVAYMAYIKSPIRYLAPFSSDYAWLAKYLGLNQFLPNEKILKFLAFECELFKVNKEICENLIFIICGFDKHELNEKILPIILTKDPSGTSTKTVIHYAQEVRNSGNFQQFDYGSKGNILQYGTLVPPKYKITNIKRPIYLMYAENDWLASPQVGTLKLICP